jgi:RimJ/RimL family protein N-acetyltransferase
MTGSPGAQEAPFILLETERLRLRRCTPRDLDALVELDADPEVMRYISFGEPTPREDYAQVILPRWLAQYAATPLIGYWLAELRDDGAFVGWFHLRPDRIDPGPQELGYRLRRSAWGQGLATEGGRALLAHGFDRVGAETITARALSTNGGSRRVMEKCGLVYESAFVWPEEVLPGRTEAERVGAKYSITRSSWRARPV